MRLHITLEDGLVRELDRRVGARRRRAFIAGAVAHAPEDAHRWELIEAALGGVRDGDHPWDEARRSAAVRSS
jgi:hypothetical protein